LQVEYADISLLGAREENQDRVAVAVAEHAAWADMPTARVPRS
jgi:hypothetical protein